MQNLGRSSLGRGVQSNTGPSFTSCIQSILPSAHSKSLVVRSQDGPTPSNNSQNDYQFTYVGNDGRLKATFEQAFKNGVPTTDGATAPWELGYQMSEKDIMWNDDLQTRLLSRFAAEELNISDEELAMRLDHLQILLPDITAKLPSMHPTTVANLLDNLDTLPGQLLNLKSTFPGANVSKLAVRAPELVLGMDLDLLTSIANQLHELLPSLDIDRLVEANPSMLDVEELRSAMAEAKRIMPQLNIEKAMGSDPNIILSFQRGSQLIPYDPPTPVDDDDDEYAAYYK